MGDSEAEEGIDAPIPKFVAFPMKMPIAQTTTASSTMANRRNGNPNCGQPELISMLRLLEEHLPIGEAAWKKVGKLHSETFPHRDVRSIRCEFTSLCQKIPTGDPGCPEEVILAKRVHFLLGQKAAAGDGEKEFELEELKHGESGANQKPHAQTVAEEVTAATSTAADGVANMLTVAHTTPVVKHLCTSSSARKEEWSLTS